MSCHTSILYPTILMSYRSTLRTLYPPNIRYDTIRYDILYCPRRQICLGLSCCRAHKMPPPTIDKQNNRNPTILPFHHSTIIHPTILPRGLRLLEDNFVMLVQVTFPPALQLVLQFLHHDAQTSVLLFLLLVLLLPFLSRQLQVHRHCVLYGLRPKAQTQQRRNIFFCDSIVLN